MAASSSLSLSTKTSCKDNYKQERFFKDVYCFADSWKREALSESPVTELEGQRISFQFVDMARLGLNVDQVRTNEIDFIHSQREGTDCKYSTVLL